MNKKFYDRLRLIGGAVNLVIAIDNNLKLRSIMKKQAQFDANLRRLDAVTNKIAADLQALKTEAEEGSISDESIAKLEANITQLEAMGKDEALVDEDSNPPLDGGGDQQVGEL